jgi:hypothetical protein
MSQRVPAIMLTTAAPMNTPGQSRLPRTNSAASAIPVGGQTSAAKPATAANAKPIRPATT